MTRLLGGRKYLVADLVWIAYVGRGRAAMAETELGVVDGRVVDETPAFGLVSPQPGGD
jgi:hypothetical protein